MLVLFAPVLLVKATLMLPSSSRIMVWPVPFPTTVVFGLGTPSTSMSAPTQPDGPLTKATLTHQAESAVTKTGAAVTTPMANRGWVPRRGPSAVARTLVLATGVTSIPTVNVGAAAEVVVGANARMSVSAAKSRVSVNAGILTGSGRDETAGVF